MIFFTPKEEVRGNISGLILPEYFWSLFGEEYLLEFIYLLSIYPIYLLLSIFIYHIV